MPPADRQRFRPVARMEWVKLRSLRSTWWTLALTGVGAVAIAVAVGLNTEDGTRDLTNNALAGIAPGLLSIGVLGVLAATNEYTSQLIRVTLAAAPDRRRLVAAKVAVFGAVALAVGEVTALVAFVAGTVTLPGSIERPGLGDPYVLRAVVLAGAGFALIGLLGLGLGLVVRQTGAAVGLLVGVVYVGAMAVAALSMTVAGYGPVSIVANSLTTVQPVDGVPSPGVGLAVLVVYVVVALGAGGWLLERRDA